MASLDVSQQTALQRSKRMWIIVAACAVAAIVVVATINRHALVRFAVQSQWLHLDLGYTVRFVVPDGYRGVFSISEDPVNGVRPSTGDHGEVVYLIPDDGHLVTTDITPMMTWHKTEATYRSGKTIGVEGDPAEVRLRGLTGFGSDGKAREIIGTSQQFDNWLSDSKDWFTIEKPDENERRE